MTDLARLADRVITEHRDRVRFHALAGVAGDPVKAYQVQEQVIDRWMAAGRGAIAGWKIGLTTPTMQAMCGIDTPIAGAILAGVVHRSGAGVRAADYGRLGVESEIALRIKATPPEDAEHDPRAVLASIEAVAAAFELVDDRDADYARLDACSMIADNSWNGGIVLGQPVPVNAAPSLADLSGALVRDGVALGEGRATDLAQIVGWLSDLLRRRGRLLEPGQWVMTGSVVRTEFATPGQHYHLTVADLPPVEVSIL